MSLIGPEGRKQLELAARFAAAGLELAIAIVVGYFGGRALDRWLGTDPYCGYGGLIVGVIAGFRNLFLLAGRASKAAENAASGAEPAQPEALSPPAADAPKRSEEDDL